MAFEEINMKHAFLELACTLTLALGLAACGQSHSGENVESLAANPDRLKELMRQCQEDRATVGEMTCITASHAWRKRFTGDGRAAYAPSASSTTAPAPAPAATPTQPDTP
jgi:hypothetical protein